MTAIVVPAYGKGTGASYLKHPPSRRPRYAVVGVAAIVEIKDGKVARASLVVGGATPNPVRAAAAEAALTGQKPDAAAIAAAAGEGRRRDLGSAERHLRFGRIPRPPGDGPRETCPRGGRRAGARLISAALELGRRAST